MAVPGLLMEGIRNIVIISPGAKPRSTSSTCATRLGGSCISRARGTSSSSCRRCQKQRGNGYVSYGRTGSMARRWASWAWRMMSCTRTTAPELCREGVVERRGGISVLPLRKHPPQSCPENSPVLWRVCGGVGKDDKW